jgi:hypothetical protein
LKTPLCHRLRHPELNVVVVFAELNDRRNCPADDFQYRRDLADNAFPVSPSPFLF